MKKTLAILATAALIIVSVAGTANAGGGNKAFWGTILGAAGGGAVGTQFGKGNGRTAAIIVGTLFGAGIGQSTGRSLDRADGIYGGRSIQRQPVYQQRQPVYRQQPRYQTQRQPVYQQQPRYQQRSGTIFGTRDRYEYNQPQATYESLEYGRSGEVLPWQNQNGQRGAVIPQPAYQKQNGQYCREYITEIVVGNRVQQGYGTACRMPDGQWQIVSSSN